jgi:hypothetical protein
MKVVSFALFGDNPIYSCGAIANARLMGQIYPGWVASFFVGPSVGDDVRRSLIELGAQVHQIDEPETMISTMWRFRAALIPGVERVVFRDCDSRLTNRERDCVRQWEQSGKSLHIIRDHPWHTARILAGMWGVYGESAVGIVADVANEVGQRSAAFYGVDQEVLALNVYPKLSRDAITHDAFYNFERNTVRPPRRIGLEFIGERIDCSEDFDPQHREDLRKAENSWFARVILRVASRRTKP